MELGAEAIERGRADIGLTISPQIVYLSSMNSTAEFCTECGANLVMVGIRHRCILRSRGSTESRRTPIVTVAEPVFSKAGSRHEASRNDGLHGIAGVASSPRDTKPKRGRPRLEEAGSTLAARKPWLKTTPPMSRSSWYKRQKEKRA